MTGKGVFKLWGGELEVLPTITDLSIFRKWSGKYGNGKMHKSRKGAFIGSQLQKKTPNNNETQAK